MKGVPLYYLHRNRLYSKVCAGEGECLSIMIHRHADAWDNIDGIPTWMVQVSAMIHYIILYGMLLGVVEPTAAAQKIQDLL